MSTFRQFLESRANLEKLAGREQQVEKTLLEQLKGRAVSGGVGLVSAALGAAVKEPLVAGIQKMVRPKASLARSIFGHGGPFRTALGYGGAGLGLAAGAVVAEKGYEALTEGRHKENAKAMMLAEHPQLKHEDARIVNRSFDTLWRFNREMAKDPTVAGSFVRRAAMFKDEGIQANDVKTLTEIRKNMSDAGRKSGGGMMEHAKNLYGFRNGPGGAE